MSRSKDEDNIDKQINKRAAKYSKKYKVDDRLALYMVLEEMFDDLPDGAYFAAMEEYGYEAEDLIDCNERAQALGFYK